LLQPIGFGATTMLEKRLHKHYNNQTDPKTTQTKKQPKTNPKKMQTQLLFFYQTKAIIQPELSKPCFNNCTLKADVFL
jgi:hypothetical protein